MWAPIQRPDGDSQALQLYQLVVPFCGKILPVCQLLTEKHDAVFVSYWLKEWLRHDIPIPKSIVCDFSRALLNACSMAFNEKCLGKYLDHSIKYLIQEPGNTIYDPLECLILLDIAHFIKMITRWSCWQNARLKKDFFIRAIGLLTKASTLDIFLSTVRDVLLVAMSEYSSFDEEHSCTAATKRLLGAIATDAFPYEVAEPIVESADLEEGFFHESNAYEYATKFVNNLISETKKHVSPGPIGNPNYCPEFLKDFTTLLKFFPTWTIVMPGNPILISSSACSEEYFREVKDLCLVDKKKRSDKGHIKHIINIDGTTKLLRAKYEERVEQVARQKIEEKPMKRTEKKMTKTDILKECESSPVWPSCVDISADSDNSAKEGNENSTPGNIFDNKRPAKPDMQ